MVDGQDAGSTGRKHEMLLFAEKRERSKMGAYCASLLASAKDVGRDMNSESLRFVGLCLSFEGV